MDKKALYESIMKDVAVIVKKQINQINYITESKHINEGTFSYLGYLTRDTAKYLVNDINNAMKAGKDEISFKTPNSGHLYILTKTKDNSYAMTDNNKKSYGDFKDAKSALLKIYDKGVFE